MTELAAAGHDVAAWEPANSWSVQNLIESAGAGAVDGFRDYYPNLPLKVYDPETFDAERALDGVDLAIVHEWNEPERVAEIGRVRARNANLRILFHDTHHRSVTEPEGMSRYDLDAYDGVLAFGDSVREQYRRRGWASQVWTFHEAADTRVFHPLPGLAAEGDLVWIGNWGDDERETELREFLIEPVRDLALHARIYGVRYPDRAISELGAAGIEYRGWLPNYLAPATFARYKFTVHVPRRPYAEALSGIPTIRMFEALACGIPLISAPWNDTEGLFPAGSYLTAQNGSQMRRNMKDLLNDGVLARSLAERGLQVISERHTCAHRASELLAIDASLRPALAGTSA